ncbi:TRAP transporter substrate-binding protein [Rhodocaloribacter litoris]|uniref:TRAP transporter substrate-binding protein n=1 Tax=Rhodocaloribacter litoris TaxID=2558931 RepID=UPI00141EEF17|nr:TRAP transporter substrate-binding protein [Rhodocaloribacter litoris]QXD14450.1 TRAP transporter substrate-binding protein [Rhodocaloribacter litoris]
MAAYGGRRFLLLVLIFVLAGCSGRTGVRVIKLGHGLDPTHPVHRAMEYMGERLVELSGGTMRLQIYPSQQLGTERETLELLQIGSLGMTKVSSSVLEGFVPAFQVFGLPYLFRDDTHRFAVLDGPVGQELLRRAEPFNLRGLAYYDAGSRSFYTKDRPVLTPADLAGLKIRTQESPVAIQMVRALGGSATPIAWGELYTALQQGIVDGAENNPPSFYLSRHYEVCRYYSLDEHTSVPDVLLISTLLWEDLTPQQQGWLQEAAQASAVYQRQLWQEAVEEALAAVQEAGVEVFRPDKTPFVEAVAPLYEAFRSDTLVYGLVERIRRTE